MQFLRHEKMLPLQFGHGFRIEQQNVDNRDGFSGVYDQVVHMKELIFLEAHVEPYMRELTASDVVIGTFVTLVGKEMVGK